MVILYASSLIVLSLNIDVEEFSNEDLSIGIYYMNQHFAYFNLENVRLAGEVDNLLLFLMDGEFYLQG